MRAMLFISGTTLLIAVAGLLLWRPTLALALALLGGAVSVWRMRRPHRSAANSKPAVVEAAPANDTHEQVSPEADPGADLLARVRAAGWTVEAAQSPAPWILAASSGVRVALRSAPIGLWAAEEDITDAMAAKALDRAQYAAIICEYRPSDEAAALAKDSSVHIVNLIRLEAYLALAGSFKPAHANAPAQRRVTA